VAVIDNTPGLLRPGQYVSVRLPLGAPRQSPAVPETALVEHEGKRFVFVSSEEHRYHRRDVRTGIEADGWVEIVEGLSPGEQVVTQGAFYLKSELLLEGEE
jgi:cobalt-zinc-cadmium efflux system membrane fusion protein